jgi:hypothetical protein
VRAFPSADRAFASDVTNAIGNALADAPDDELVSAVERLLHRRYPNVTIHHQADLARLVEWDDIWYAYRDGRIRPVSAERERLYDLLAAARRTTDDSAAILERSQTVARSAKF